MLVLEEEAVVMHVLLAAAGAVAPVDGPEHIAPRT